MFTYLNQCHSSYRIGRFVKIKYIFLFLETGYLSLCCPFRTAHVQLQSALVPSNRWVQKSDTSLNVPLEQVSVHSSTLAPISNHFLVPATPPTHKKINNKISIHSVFICPRDRRSPQPRFRQPLSSSSLSVWPDWVIYWTLGNFLKPLATINLSKSPTFLGNF